MRNANPRGPRARGDFYWEASRRDRLTAQSSAAAAAKPADAASASTTNPSSERAVPAPGIAGFQRARSWPRLPARSSADCVHRQGRRRGQSRGKQACARRSGRTRYVAGSSAARASRRRPRPQGTTPSVGIGLSSPWHSTLAERLCRRCEMAACLVNAFHGGCATNPSQDCPDLDGDGTAGIVNRPAR